MATGSVAGGSYAVDDVLGLNGRFSRILQKHVCRLAADTSFAKAGEHVREMLGASLCAETIRTLVESHGRAMAKFQPTDSATAEAFRKAPGEVEFAVDAGKVNTREGGWKDPKIAAISKRESGAPASPEGWEGHRLPAASMVLAFAMVASAKACKRWTRTTPASTCRKRRRGSSAKEPRKRRRRSSGVGRACVRGWASCCR